MGWVTLPIWATILITVVALLIYGISMYYIYELGRKDERRRWRDRGMIP